MRRDLPLIPLLLLLPTLLIASGCSLFELYRQDQAYQADALVAEHVHSALLADARLQQSDITVLSYRHDVTLSGHVPFHDDAVRAERIAQATEGVRSVNNQLIARVALAARD
jgi:hypothetical protein